LLELKPPNLKSRKEMFKHHIEKEPKIYGDINLNALADQTRDMAGANTKKIIDITKDTQQTKRCRKRIRKEAQMSHFIQAMGDVKSTTKQQTEIIQTMYG
jgi:SpoVK/Ycf46/Vps4 family AAA+-type ATPase